MSGRKSKDKGKVWENEVAKFLSKTFDDSFTRVPFSGAYVGGKNSSRKAFLGENQIRAHKGDIFPPEEWTHYNVECKNYADFPFHQLFYGDIKILDCWIQQVYETSDSEDLNVIYIKITRKGKWVVFESAIPFAAPRSIKYKDWVFCEWEHFWSFPENVRLMRERATHDY